MLLQKVDNMGKLKLCVLGYGNAGRAFGLMLHDKHEDILHEFDVDVQITRVVTGSHGTVSDPNGINIPDVEKVLDGGGYIGDPQSADFGRTALEIAQTDDYDVLLELTPLEIFTGQPATDHIRAALSRGKHAISANKGPVAWYYDELAALAEKNGVHFYFETAVMDGTPIFNLYDETLKLTKVTGISGILNSTTNFILDGLAAGRPMDEIMDEGRKLGFVESDPSMDTLGWDAAAKTAALMNVLMGAGTNPELIKREGIENVRPAMIEDAAARGKRIKLLCRGYIDEEGKAVGEVGPAYVDEHDILATVSGTTSLVIIETDLMGKLAVVEIDPLIRETAYGIFSDVLRVIRNT
jgi:homoserine dehydrogenase